jgi:hypothetical protein
VPDGKLNLHFRIVPASGAKDPPFLPGKLFFSSMQISPSGPVLPPIGPHDYFQPYQPGQEISFHSHSANVLPSECTTGFSRSESIGTWTVGSEATIRLKVPISKRDLLFEADVGAFFPANKRRQIVIGYANGHRVGQWFLSATAPVRQALVIPRGFVEGGDKVAVQFQIAYPISPAEEGRGADLRKLGLFFTRMKIDEAGSAK